VRGLSESQEKKKGSEKASYSKGEKDDRKSLGKMNRFFSKAMT
jgi:hypothetical protein